MSVARIVQYIHSYAVPNNHIFQVYDWDAYLKDVTVAFTGIKTHNCFKFQRAKSKHHPLCTGSPLSDVLFFYRKNMVGNGYKPVTYANNVEFQGGIIL